MSKQCHKEQYAVSQDEVQPWHRLGGVEHICELRKSSSVLYSMFVTTLRTIYATKKGRIFGCPSVVWNKDPQKTKIWIDTELRWEDQRPDVLPAIYVNLGEMQYEVLPTLDMQGRTGMNPSGEQHYERLASGSATFVHLGNTTGEACALADNTEYFLSSLQDQIASQYCFEHFTVAGRAPLRKQEQGQTAGKDKIASLVSVKFDFVDSWIVKFETPILKAVSMIPDQPSGIIVSGDYVDTQKNDGEIEFGNMATDPDMPVDA